MVAEGQPTAPSGDSSDISGPGERPSFRAGADRSAQAPLPELVRELVYRYCRALDRLDAALLRACFHADAQIDMGAIYRGPATGFVDVAMTFMRRMAITRHVVGNILCVGNGYESYVDAWHLIEDDRGPRELLVRARYLQRVAQQNGYWAFSYHSEVIDFGAEQPADRSWFDAQRGLPRGSRGPEDASTQLMKSGGLAR